MDASVRVLNIPNAITMIRIIVIPVFIAAILYDSYRYALYLFILAAITDLLDGLAARLTNQKTALGTFLDPLADKFLLVSSFILFSFYGWIPKWLAIAVISRDLIVVTGWLILYFITHTSQIRPVITGKISIALQLVTLAAVLVKVNYDQFPEIPFSLFLVTAVITSLSGIHYIYKGLTVTHAA